MEHNYIGGKTRENFKEFEELFNGVEVFMGYVPNAHLAMAERPELLIAFSSLARTIFQTQGVDIAAFSDTGRGGTAKLSGAIGIWNGKDPIICS